MKRRGLCYLIIASTLALLVGCGARTETTGAPDLKASKEPITFIMGNAAPRSEDNHLYQWCEEFKRLVGEASNGQIVIENHYSDLGGERDLFEGVQIGSVDLCIIANGPVGNFVPDVFAFDFPFLFRDFDHVQKVFDGEIGDDLKNRIEEKANVVVLDWAINGFRQLTNSLRPVAHPSDLKGMKIRTMENQIHMESFSALGADPTPMSASELYTALAQHTVNAMESPLTYIIPSKFYEVQDYLSITNHFYCPSVVAMNKAKFESLSEDQRAMMLECAEKATAFQTEFCLMIDHRLIEKAEEQGMVVTYTDMEEFREATKSVYDNHPEFAEILGRIQAVE